MPCHVRSVDDLKDIRELEDIVKRTDALLVLLTGSERDNMLQSDYFRSKNCVRELQEAHRLIEVHKRDCRIHAPVIVFVLETDPNRGGVPLEVQEGLQEPRAESGAPPRGRRPPYRPVVSDGAIPARLTPHHPAALALVGSEAQRRRHRAHASSPLSAFSDHKLACQFQAGARTPGTFAHGQSTGEPHRLHRGCPRQVEPAKGRQL